MLQPPPGFSRIEPTQRTHGVQETAAEESLWLQPNSIVNNGPEFDVRFVLSNDSDERGRAILGAIRTDLDFRTTNPFFNHRQFQ